MARADKRELLDDLRSRIDRMKAGGSFPLQGDSSQTEVASCEGDAKEAYTRIVRWAGVRELSCADARKRLAQEGFEEDAVSAALDRAQRLGIIDDARFAESFCRQRIRAGRGMQGIRAELENRGIDASDVQGCQATGGEETEIDRALEVLRKKPPTSKNQREGAYRRLMQKGYGSSVSSTAARLWAEKAI